MKSILLFLKPNTLQAKIIMVLTLLLVLMILTFGTVSLHIIADILETQIGKRALSVSKAVAEITEVRYALMEEDHSVDVQGIAERIREKTDAEFIVIGDRQGRRYSHPDVEKIGKKMVGGDNAPALLEGKSYISKAIGTLGPSIRGKVPVLDYEGNIVGVVSTGYLIREVNHIISTYQLTLKIMIMFMAIVGFFSSVIIAKSFKKAIFGLEPQEIAQLFQERNAILESIREGVIAVNEKGEITVINQAALAILRTDTAEGVLGKKLDDSIPAKIMMQVLATGQPVSDIEANIGDVSTVINMFPIKHEGKQIGAVASFRRKDEVYRLAKELSKVREFSDMLRAQTHEFSNKLHTIAGLLQIEAYQDALDMITKEATGYHNFYKLMNKIVSDPMLSAIIIGKYNFAQEHDIQVVIEEESMMKDIPKIIDREKLVTVIGNLFDNAFDAVNNDCAAERKVCLFMTDIGRELIFEIEDSGCGIRTEDIQDIFEKGYSTKADYGRGYGLHLVKTIIEEMDGTVSVSESRLGGALFTVAVPKKMG